MFLIQKQKTIFEDIQHLESALQADILHRRACSDLIQQQFQDLAKSLVTPFPRISSHSTDPKSHCVEEMSKSLDKHHKILSKQFEGRPEQSSVRSRLLGLNRSLALKVDSSLASFVDFARHAFADGFELIKAEASAKEQRSRQAIVRGLQSLEQRRELMQKSQLEYVEFCSSRARVDEDSSQDPEKQLKRKEKKDLLVVEGKLKREYMQSHRSLHDEWARVRTLSDACVVRNRRDQLRFFEDTLLLSGWFAERFPTNRDGRQSICIHTDLTDTRLEADEGPTCASEPKIYLVESEYITLKNLLRENAQNFQSKRKSRSSQKGSSLLRFFRTIQSIVDVRVSKFTQECLLLSHRQNARFVNQEKREWIAREMDTFLFKECQQIKFFFLNFVLFLSIKLDFDDLNWLVFGSILRAISQNSGVIFAEHAPDNQLIFLCVLLVHFVQVIASHHVHCARVKSEISAART